MTWIAKYEPHFPRSTRHSGRELYEMGDVELSRVDAGGVVARVGFSPIFNVRIVVLPTELEIACNCPGFSRARCEHLWATLFALDAEGYSPPAAWRDHLRSQPLSDDQETSLPRKPEPPPEWKQRLSAIRAAGLARVGEPPDAWRSGHEVVYHIDLEETLGGRGLTIHVLHRRRRQDGEWSKPQPLSVGREMLDSVPETGDREVLATLLGATPEQRYYYDAYAGPTSSVFRLPSAMEPSAVRALCGTGRCFLRMSENEAVPLSWDPGEPWRFRVRVRGTSQTYGIEGRLFRGDAERPLEAPELVTASGLVFAEGRAAELDHGGAFDWMAQLRGKGAIQVPREQGEEIRAAFVASPRRPPMDLPGELGFDEIRTQPKPGVGLRPAPWKRDELEATLVFVYGDVRASEEDRGWCVREGDRVHVRDIDAERAAGARLAALGAKRRTHRGREEGPRYLPARRLAQLVRALAQEGWRVEAEGKIYRSASRFGLRVSSGVDWFDLDATAEFDDQTVSLPRLLAALRKGESTVVLDDGSVGMLPEEWLRRHKLLAAFGSTQGDSLRFRRSQAGLLDALLAEREIEADDGFVKAREALRRFEGIRAVVAPQGFVGQLRDYQALGLGWMAFLREFGFGGCLADDMGLGKTVQVLALLASRRDVAGKPSLVVVPRSLVFNWKQEAARFAPGLRVLDHTGIGRDHGLLGDHDLVLTTYGTLRRDAAELKDVAFDYAILDESQAIKNRGTESAKAARLLRADHRLALSGTPVENHLGELWSLFEFLNPGVLGHVALTNGANDLDDEGRTALARALAPFILRRTKEQVAKDLPAKTEQTLWCDLDEEQKALCDELRDHYRASLRDSVAREGLGQSKIQVLEALLRLRQAACHPGLVDPKRADGPSAKLDALVPRLVEIVQEGHKALVFSQFTSFLALLRPRLDAAGVPYDYLDGRTRDREARVRSFNEARESRVFLISLKAGGLGLNLTAAEYVFLLDPWWNPAVEAQAIDRTHRIGQTRPVFAYRMVARGTIEEKVLALQETKRSLADAIVRADESFLKNLTRDDLEELLAPV